MLILPLKLLRIALIVVTFNHKLMLHTSNCSASKVDTPANVANNIPMECYDISDPLLTAICKLETIASQNGFTIHDLPADGDCMFSAIVYQLTSTGICDVDSQTWRQNFIDYMLANKASYCDFVSASRAN